MKRFCLLMIIAMQIVFSCCVYAETECKSVLADGNYLTVNGTFDDKTIKAFTLTVMNPQFGETSITDMNIEQSMINMTDGISDENGNFSARLRFDRNNDAGTYKIRISVAGRNENLYFDYPHLTASGDNSVEAEIDKLNQIESESAFKTEIELYHSTLGLSFEGIYEDVTDKMLIYSHLLGQKPYADEKALKSAFYGSCATAAVWEMRSNPEHIISELTEYNDIFGVDIKWLNKLANKEAAVTEVFSTEYMKIADLRECFDKKIGAKAFSELLRGDMEELINSYSEYLTLPSDYLSWNSDKKVELYKCIETAGTFSSLDDVSQKILNFKYVVPGTNNDSPGDSNTPSGNGGGRDNSYLFSELPQKDKEETKESDVFDINTYFTDINEAKWAEEAIEYLYAKKVIAGKGNNRFEPNAAALREEAVKMLVSAFDVPETETDTSFKDVNSDEWYYPYIIRAAEYGLVNGISEDAFGIGSCISRQDFAVIVYRMCRKLNIPISERRPYVTFEDVDAIADYAKDAVRVLYMSEVLSGTQITKFEPTSPVTRAMIAKIIYEIENIRLGEEKTK